MKQKCSICKARSVLTTNYRNKLLCPECLYEYKAIFEGWQSNKSKKNAAYIQKMFTDYDKFKIAMDESWKRGFLDSC